MAQRSHKCPPSIDNLKQLYYHISQKKEGRKEENLKTLKIKDDPIVRRTRNAQVVDFAIIKNA
jgi:hypothetical protein